MATFTEELTIEFLIFKIPVEFMLQLKIYMFSSHGHLKRKTPAGGIDRRQYIGHLVDEYYTSTNVGKQ